MFTTNVNISYTRTSIVFYQYGNGSDLGWDLLWAGPDLGWPCSGLALITKYLPVCDANITILSQCICLSIRMTSKGMLKL